MLRVGDVAPPFQAPSTLGRDVSLVEHRGRVVVLYFFRRAFTRNCTVETRGFRDNHAELRVLGADVIGVSPDDFPTQCAFAQSSEVSFPLIADVDKAITSAYRVRFSLLPTIHRVTYVIDREGVISGVFNHEFQVLKHLDEVLRFVRTSTAPPRPSPSSRAPSARPT